jgi:Insertion element 4 transposase N-terminal/Transposase DDE domain
MARTLAELPAGSRITDYISLGVIAKFFPVEKIHDVLEQTNRASVRERDLPAHVVVYYVIALALYMRSSYREVLRCLLEGVQWLLDPSAKVKVAGKSGISQARSRLGVEPVKKLYDAVVTPIAEKRTKGAWFRQWRLVSLDGSTLDVADTVENDEAFGRPGASRGSSAFPKIRFVALLENGTHVLWAAHMDQYATDELTLAETVIPSLRQGMLCMADRFFPSYKLWRMAAKTGADLLWRTRQNARLDVEKRLTDGSYLSRIYASTSDPRNGRNGVVVRVIDYRLKDVEGSEPLYRLITTILDHEQAPARELAALYHERWEIETTLDELKTHLRGAQIVLRSKTPDLVRQEFFGLMMAHFAVRGLMHEAALKADEDPDRLSFLHSVRVLQRRMARYAAIPPSAEKSLPRSDPRRNS